MRKRTRLGSGAFGLASFAAMLLVVGLAFFRLDVLDLQGLVLALGAVAALVVVALLFAFVAMAKAWRFGHRGGGRAVAGFALAALVAVPFAAGIALAFEYPDTSMAETEGIEPNGMGGEGGGSPAILLGRDFSATAADVYSAARATIEADGWEVVDVEASRLVEPTGDDLGISGTVLVPVPTLRDTLDAEETDEGLDPYAASDSDRYTIEAVAFTPLLGFASDVTVRIAEVEGTSFVDMRSVSRDLPRDLGQNRRFIEGFLNRLDAAMTLLQSGPGSLED